MITLFTETVNYICSHNYFWNINVYEDINIIIIILCFGSILTGSVLVLILRTT